MLKMPCQTEWYIETDCPIFVSKLAINYGNYLNEHEYDNRKTPDIKVLKSKCGGYIVEIDKISINTTCPVHYINRFLFENTKYDSNIMAFHGAAVEFKEKSYIFLASTTTGKTTLTSYLVHCGYGYITDDCVLLDQNSYRVYPFSTPLHLRKGGMDILKSYNALPKDLKCFSEQGTLCRYTYTPEKTVNYSLPIGEIFILERTENENAVLTMNANEKLTSFLYSPITPYPVTADYLRFLSELGKLYGKRIKYCSMDFVKEEISKYAK